MVIIRCTTKWVCYKANLNSQIKDKNYEFQSRIYQQSSQTNAGC